MCARLPLQRGVYAAAALAFTGGCSGIQSALDPAGPQADLLSNLWWLFLAVCTVVFFVVAAFLLVALFRRRAPVEEPIAETNEPGSVRAVIFGAVATAVILIILLIASVGAGRAMQPPASADQVDIVVTGHQWWWRFHVLGDNPSQSFETANEIHIPVGRPVRFEIESRDVIHSFWVPNLHGKIDAIPGRTNVLWLRADRPGVYRGQCAEFCGLQHAHMGMVVIAQPEEEWLRWVEQQRRPARPPQTEAELRGQQVFLTGPCVVCHTVRGTPAHGGVAPDLTHLASRRTIAAATLPNRRGHLGGWILDSQHVKPGNMMPPNHLEGRELQDLLTWLETLK